MILLLACAGEEPRAPEASVAAPQTAPDLVMVGIGGLRSDGASRAAEWFLSPFAQDHGVVFSNAYAQTPSTYVSIGSLLTGRYPSAIPMCGFPSEPDEQTAPPPWCTRFPDTAPSLPYVLGLYGYRTALITADIQGSAELATQFQQSFVVSESWENTATDWAAVTAAAQKWWDADATRPRFLFVATADMNVRWIPVARAELGLEGVARAEGAPIDRARVLAGYQKRAAASGTATKALLDALPSTRPRWAAVFGIHGINLGDTFVPTQALRDRSWSDIVIDRTLHVPLALIGPAPSAQIDPALVELVDLVPTFTTLAGAVAPTGMPGRDLLAGGAEPDATAYGEFGDMLSVRQGDQTLSVRAFFFNRSSLDPELTNYVLNYNGDPHNWALHDLRTDPFQERNRLLEDRTMALRMKDLLVALRTGPGAPPGGSLDPRKVWELRMAPADGYW